MRASEVLAATQAGDILAAVATENRERAARETLVRSLHDREWTVRSSAAIALGRSRTVHAFPDLLKLYTDKRRDVRKSAGIAVGVMGEPLAAQRVSAVLFDPAESEELRAVAALALGFMGGADAAAELSRFLDPASDALRVGGIRRTALLKETAVAGLGISGHAPASALLAKILADPKARVRQRAFAADALARLGDRKDLPLLLQALRADPEMIRRSAAAAVAGLAGPGDAAAIAELARVARDDRDPTVRRFALLSLGRIGGDTAGAALQRLLGLAPAEDRPFAALAVGVAGARDVAPALRAMLRAEKSLEARGAFAIALGLLRDREASADLVAGAKDPANPVLRMHFLTALLAAENPVLPALAREVLAKETYDPLRLRAAFCLAATGESDGVPALAGLTKTGCCQFCRADAARTLGRIGSPRALGVLSSIAREATEVPLRTQAIWAMGRILDRAEVSEFARLGMKSPFPMFRGPMQAALAL